MANQETNASERYRQERKERIAKAAKKNQKKSHNVTLSKKSKTAIAIVLVIAIALGIGGFAISNSGVLERGKVAFSVGDTEVTAAEYGYYYNNVFSQYFNYSYQYDTYYGNGMGKIYTGYDYTVAPNEQTYSGDLDGIENPKWTDYFDNSAKESIKYIKACLLYAEKNNIVLDDDDKSDIEENLASIESNAKEANYSLAAYLRTYYGKGMSKALLKTILEEQTIAQKVQKTKTEEFESSYSDALIDKTYEKEIQTYGVVTFRNYKIEADTVEVPAKEEGGDPTNEVTDKTMAEAKIKADSFVAKAKDEKSFVKTAYEFEKLNKSDDADKYKNDSQTLVEDQTYSNVSQASNDKAFLKWIFSKDTAKNSTYIVKDSDGYSIYMMVSPVHHTPDELTYDVRHILVKFPDDADDAAADENDKEKAEDKEDKKEDEKKEPIKVSDFSKYDAVVDIRVDEKNDSYTDLYNKAENILKEYLDGKMTEDAFGELAKKYSEDGNAKEGGIYENVEKGKMVAEFEGWCLDENRKPGDVGIVESEFGYHIMYAIGTNTSTWKDAIKADLSEDEYSEFVEEISSAKDVEIKDIEEANVASVEDFVVKLAKTQIRNIQSAASSGTDHDHDH